METKCIIGTVLFSAGTFVIGYYLGKSQSEKELKPRVDNHLERIKYLENGITKNQLLTSPWLKGQGHYLFQL